MFMQNLTLSQVLRTGMITLGYSSSIVTGFIDLDDLATVIRSIMLSPARHFLAQYELVGQNASYEDVSRTIAALSLRDIQCNVMSREEFIGRMKATGELQSEYAEDAIERLMLYYNRWRVQSTLCWLFRSGSLGDAVGVWQGIQMFFVGCWAETLLRGKATLGGRFLAFKPVNIYSPRASTH